MRNASLNELADKAGGYYSLITLMNLRMRQIRDAHQKPLVEGSLNDLRELVRREIIEDKISFGGENEKF